jgi:hypothetical protein
MKVLCFALFACAFNLLLGFGGLLSFGHAMFLGSPATSRRTRPRSGAGRRSWHPGGTASPPAGPGGAAGHPPPGHLLRDDHAGAGADGLLLLPAGAVHRRRGRHPGGAARQPVRRLDLAIRPTMYYVVLAIFVAASWHLPHRAFAVRPGAEGDPRERAARHLAGLRHRPLQAAGLRAVGRAGRPGRRAPRRWSSSSPR